MSTQGAVVHVEPLGRDLVTQPGETLIEAAWRLGYHWPSVCLGQASCTVCRVEVLQGADQLTPIGAEEQHALDHRLPATERIDRTVLRLACRAVPVGEVTVRRDGVHPRGRWTAANGHPAQP